MTKKKRKNQKRDTKKIKLNLGCGVYLKKDFINVDKYFTLKDLKGKKPPFQKAIIEKGAEFIQADILKLPFPDNFADYIACTETIEHMAFKQVLPFFFEMKRVLKPGGKLDITTIDFNYIVKVWKRYIIDKKSFNINHFIELLPPIYGNQNSDGEFHRCPFTPEFMKWCLDQIHFKKYQIIIYPSGARYPVTQASGPAIERKNLVCMGEMIMVKTIK